MIDPIILGPAAVSAIASLGRRYAAGLTGLFGPAAAFGGFGLALRATPAQRWAAQRSFPFWLSSLAAGAHGLKPMVVGLCKERAKALLCSKCSFYCV